MQRESAPGEGGKQRFLPDLRQFVANILQTTQRRKLGFPCFSASSCIYKRSATAVQHISIVNLILSFQLLILDIFRHTSLSTHVSWLVTLSDFQSLVALPLVTLSDFQSLVALSERTRLMLPTQ